MKQVKTLQKWNLEMQLAFLYGPKEAMTCYSALMHDAIILRAA